ncbi:MAG: hypothetical protein AAFR42_20040 [Cyanobacteria bacterium J06628_6]
MTETATVSYRHEVNPAIAFNLLNDLQSAITRLQHQLRQVVGKIKALYAEGPVVNGWLESSTDTADTASSDPSAPTDPSALFRHGDVEDLIAYVQAIEPQETPLTVPTTSQPDESPRYRLCQLDATGQVRSQLCPPEQVPTVSMAIVRYQKLSKLVSQKQTLEAKLRQVVDTLGDLKTLLA